MTMTLDGTAGITAPQGAVYNGLQTATAQTSASGTSIDFTGIPIWVKRVTVIFNAVSTNGTSQMRVRVGSGTFATTGYVSYGAYAGGTNQAAGDVSTTAFIVDATAAAAAQIRYGTLQLTLLTGNTWVATSMTTFFNGTNYYQQNASGSVTLSGVLDRVRITTVNGTDTFDAGTINIIYE